MSLRYDGADTMSYKCEQTTLKYGNLIVIIATKTDNSYLWKFSRYLIFIVDCQMFLLKPLINFIVVSVNLTLLSISLIVNINEFSRAKTCKKFRKY